MSLGELQHYAMDRGLMAVRRGRKYLFVARKTGIYSYKDPIIAQCNSVEDAYEFIVNRMPGRPLPKYVPASSGSMQS
jgi:hypothetical protein